MINEIKAEVSKAIEVAREAYPNATIRMPDVELSNRMTKASGVCTMFRDGRKPKIKFSTQIIKDNGLEQIINQNVCN